MRELKFRAYDSVTHKVSEPFDVKESWGDYLVDFDDYSTDGALDSIIWEQFTGLLDRNGKEIYEGDIVQCGAFVGQIKWLDRLGCWGAGDTVLYSFLKIKGITLSTSKIIGNIHENPELLGGEE